MKTWAMSLCLTLVLATCATAQPVSAPQPNPFVACKADMNSLCKEAPGGIPGKLQCLKTNQDKLSPDCVGAIKAVLGAVSAKVATTENTPRPVKACQQELATLCPDIAQGEGGRIKCLRDNSPKLSPACSDSLKTARAQSQDILKTCNADRERLCPGQKPAEQLKCMKDKQADLSPDCRQAVASVKAAVKKASKEAGAAPKAEAPGAAPPPQAPPVAKSAAVPPPALKPTQ